MRVIRGATAAVLGAVFALGMAGIAKAGSAYTKGDVFLGIQSVGVNEYTPTGTFVQTINGGGLTGYVTGMAFQNNGDLLVTDFSTGNVAQYDNSGNLINATWASGLHTPESIAINSSGDVYVSNVGSGGITEFASSGGSPIGQSISGTRTDWIDLASDQHTMLYGDESGTIHSVNVATNTSNPDFCTGCGQYALRIIPSGPDAGDVLAADSSGANLISSTGTILKTYNWAGNDGGDFALNIDPNGTSFWTADDVSGNVAEFNIATGALEESWSPGGPGSKTDTVFGLVVFGQQTASGGGGGGTSSVPEPSTFALLGIGLAGLFAMRKRSAATL